MTAGEAARHDELATYRAPARGLRVEDGASDVAGSGGGTARGRVVPDMRPDPDFP
jgi:hypothetical protein